MDEQRQRHFDKLLDNLHSSDVERRTTAALGMRDFGAEAVKPLCEALKDECIEVRAVAAESLGRIGDARAVQSLLAALRKDFIGRSAWMHVAAGFLIVPSLFGLMGVVWFIVAIMACVVISLVCMEIGKKEMSGFDHVIGLAVASLSALLILLVRDRITHFVQRRRENELHRTIVDALMHIAEQNPTPELRAALPDLKAVAADMLQQSQHTRTTARQTARRIEALTEQLKNLPLPASAPPPDAATLPRIVDMPTTDVKTLPRVE